MRMKQTSRRYGKIAVNLLIAIIVLLAAVFLLPKVLVFFMPFLIGWIIACIANPLIKFLEERLRFKRKAVTALVIISVIALVVLAGYGIIVILVEQITGFVHYLPTVWASLEADLMDIGKNLEALLNRFPVEVQWKFEDIGKDMELYTSGIVEKIGTPTMQAVGSFARNIPSVIISIIMCALSSYFFIAEKEYVGQFVRKHTPVSLQQRWNMVFGNLKKAVGGYFKAQLKIEFWIYLLLVIGLFVLNIDYALLIALGIAILDILPFFGTGIVLIPWAIVKFLSADYKMFIGLLIIWGVGQLVRQLIQPKIVGDSIGVAPLPTLFFLFIGYRVAGMLGMIISVPVGIIIIKLDEEGVFDTAKNSLRLFIKSINDFRRLDEEDIRYLEDTEIRKEKNTGDGKQNENNGI